MYTIKSRERSSRNWETVAAATTYEGAKHIWDNLESICSSEKSV